VAGQDAGDARTAVQTVADRVRALQAEAKGLAREHVQELERLLLEVEKMSAEIAEGGEAYPAGVRDIARRLVEDCEARVQTLEAIVSRAD
jgi:enoyl-CoA hydratase/carnithine racemase